MARALPAHDRQHRAGDVHGTEEHHRQLLLDLLWGQLLEEAGDKTTSIFDQHIDPPKAFNRRLHGRLGIGGFGDVQPDHQQLVRLTDCPGHGVRSPLPHDRQPGPPLQSRRPCRGWRP